MPHSDKKRINFILSEIKLGPQALADKIQIPVYKIKSIKGGKTKFSVELALLIEEFFNFNFKWLLTGKGSPYVQKDEELPVDGPPTADNMVELQHMNLVKGFVDKQRALNIDRELLELEKLDPENFKRVESYIKGTVDAVREVVKRNVPHRIERRVAQRRITDDPDLMPDGLDRRSGLDRRMAVS